MLAPKIIADNNDPRSSDDIFFRCEGATKRRRQSDHRQEIRADPRGRNAARGIVPDRAHGYICSSSGADPLKNITTKFPPLPESLLAQSESPAPRSVFVGRLVKTHQSIRIWKWQRAKKCAFEYRKNRGVSCDPDRQRQYGLKTKARRLDQHSE